MGSTVVVEILLGLLTFAVGFYAVRQNASQSKQSDKALAISVDAAAYERAKEIWESAVKTRTDQIDSLLGELEDTRQQLREAKAEMIRLRHSNSELSIEVDGMRAELAKYRGEHNPGGAV